MINQQNIFFSTLFLVLLSFYVLMGLGLEPFIGLSQYLAFRLIVLPSIAILLWIQMIIVVLVYRIKLGKFAIFVVVIGLLFIIALYFTSLGYVSSVEYIQRRYMKIG